MTGMFLGAVWAAIALVTAILWVVPAVDRDTIRFGVRVPAGHARAPAVVAAVKTYRWQVVAVGVFAAVAAGALWSLVPFGVLLAAVGALLAVALTIAYAHAHRTVQRAKVRGGWYQGQQQQVAVDTSLRTAPEPVPWWAAMPSLAVILGVVVTGVVTYQGLPDQLVVAVQHRPAGTEYVTADTTVLTAFFPVFLQVALTAGLFLLVRWTMRARAELDPARPHESSQRHRRFLRIWAHSLFVVVFGQNVALAAVAGLIWTDSLADAGAVVMALVVAPVVAVSVLVWVVALRAGQAGWRLHPQRAAAGAPAATGVVPPDDDRHWRLGGLVYLNREDPSLLALKRGGFGWTINLGHRLSWLVVGGLVATVLTGLALVVMH